jgi:predicted DNA-binding protein
MRIRTEMIGFRASEEDRAALKRLAEREERTQADVLRRLIQKALTEERAPDRRDGAFVISGGP